MPSPLTGQMLSASLYGDPVYKGVIVATASATNGTTAAPFLNTGDALAGKILLIQPDAACYFRQVEASGDTVTASNGVKLSADQAWYVNMRSTKGFVAALPVSGTVNLRVFEMNG